MLKTTGKTILVLSIFIFAASSLAACGGAQAPTLAPTQDLNPLRTEVAATVIAQIPQILAQTPSATLNPTATVAPTATATVEQATVTSTPAAAGTAQTNDHALWVAQNVQDNAVFTPGQEFTMTWQIKNDGTSTWTTKYHLRHYAGDAFGAPNDIILDQEVKPGETADITVEMKAPAKPGDYRTDWVLSNESLRNFKDPIFLKVKVAAPATATRTATTAPTKTTAPTQTVTPTPKS